MRFKKGDTLIEVALAIGIFSMVAVAVVAVVSSSTTNAQSALESTVTREEIDAQAEALRFIQSSYIAGGYANAQDSSGDLQKYANIWDEIVDQAIDPSKVISSEEAEKILRFNPASCASVYNSSDLSNQGAFVINTRKLSSSNPTEIVIRARGSSYFHETSTYPRIIYGPYDAAADVTPDGLLEQGYQNYISRVEGIFIVAVKDPGTSIVSSGSVTERSAYYDFYIRTCWYNPGADNPSTISTVIRLQDPASINYGSDGAIAKRDIITFNPNGDDVTGEMPTQSIRSGSSVQLRKNSFSRVGYDFVGWNTVADGSGTSYADEASYQAPNLTANRSVTLYAQWRRKA